MSLALQYSDIIHKNIDKFDKNFKSNNAQITPLIGDFTGNGMPNHLYVGRTGQLIPLDIYNSDNYNIIVIGPMGSGKSVWTNDFLAKAVNAGWFVRMIDFGRSYIKFAQTIGGQFVEFSPESDICMNFFTEINTKIEIRDEKEITLIADDEIEMLVPIVGFMAGMNLQDIYKDTTVSGSEKMNMTVLSVLIANAINHAFRIKGRDAGMREVREALIDFKEKALEKGEQNIVDQLVQIIVTLEPYSLEDGQYFKYFNGASNLNFDNNFFILELDDISTSPIMPVVAMLYLQKTAREAFIGYQKDKNARRIVGVDEAWKVLSNPLFAKFLEDFARRIRKYFGIPMIITQQVDEFFQNPQAEAIYKTADWKIFLPHSKDAIDQAVATGKISLSDFDLSLFKSLKSRYPHYSEFFVKQKRYEFVALLKLTPYGYWLSTSNPKDRAKTDVVMKTYNLTLQDAIIFQSKQMEGYEEEEIFEYLSSRNKKSLDIDWDKFFKKVLKDNSIKTRKEAIVNLSNKSIELYENLPSLMNGKIEYFPKDFIYKAKELKYFFKIKQQFIINIFQEEYADSASNSINISLDGIRNKKFNTFLFEFFKKFKERKFFLEMKLDYNDDGIREVVEFVKKIQNLDANVEVIFDNMKFDNINLSSLINFKPEFIKMTIDELRANQDKKEFIDIIFILEEHFNIKTIITFIETEEDLALVSKIGLSHVQGYYIADNLNQLVI